MVQRPLAPKWVMAAAPVVVAALAFLGFQIGGDGGQPELVVVPAVVALTEAEAIAQLEAAGFAVEVARVASDQVPQGLVVSTAPPAGQSVESGSSVALFVSDGSGPGGGAGVEIPDLVLSSIEDARLLLEGLGLVVEVQQQSHDEIDPGQVISTEPPAGAEVPAGTTVRVVVSSGPAQPLPDLELFLQPGCEIIGRGGLSGGDVITFFFRALSVGEVPYDGSVRATATSDSGLIGQGTTGVSRDSAVSFVQVEVGPGEYGRIHTFAVVIEAIDSIDEADDSNNGATVEVPLPGTPPEPGQVIDPCS
jgi:hypothetical protein